ncbi:SAM-dependent methyltransferase [Rhodovulum viride]|uniref:SAM-dependent methyltransferase n=1 Tax=Rhodovulum viride TaxID=1231134 RepID=A0ABX9DJR7_9RHOB|nr:class I SAM-dependent methyltransferase [Rhodovulum viride]RAP41914.1 SAM-dependent methyltransferase [Rhodovulum viride]
MTRHCRFCQAPLEQTLVDLGETPLANSFLPDSPESIAAERRFPLHVMVCTTCWLAQTTETVPADAIFAHDYAYLSSYSAGWVAHARRYAEAMADRFGLGAGSRVVEIASNDGYLLQHFVAMGVPVLGVEPAGHAAEVAESIGVPTRVMFFDETSAAALRDEGFAADLMAANNVLAHVPDIRSFAAGFRVLLKPEGVATFEFPHLARLIEQVQFDTIYHEHYSYLSLTFVERLMREVGLSVFDIERLPTHGGSLRVFVGHPGAHAETEAVAALRAEEAALQLDRPEGYAGLAARVARVVADFRAFVARARAEGKTIAGYGAAAKGNTFLNVAGIGRDDIAFVVDRNPQKQNRLLPGSHIPVLAPEEIARQRPDYLVILPWNIAEEVMDQQAAIRDWGGRFVTAVPELIVR